MKLIIFLSALAVLAGCGDFNNFYREKKTNSESRPGGPGVVAVIGSEGITLDELMEAVNKLPLKKRKMYLSSGEKLNEFLDSYINQKIIYEEALKRGIDRREDIIERTESFKKQLVGQAFAQDILNDINIGERDIQKYYDTNKEDFERVGISVIFIKPKPKEGLTKQDAFARAEMVSERAQAGEDFEKLTREYSDDMESIKMAGKVGYVEKGRYPVHIEEKIFSMAQGEISKPLEVEDGFYIIKIDETAGTVPDGQIKRKIRSELVNKKVIEYVNGLRKDWGVLTYKERLEEKVKSD
ncbi:MAG: peptidylprolyl isomerase [Deltaproteobacteria bacterium]